jgi:hypothetical protein
MAADGHERALRMQAAVRARVGEHGVGQGARVRRRGWRVRWQLRGLPAKTAARKCQAGNRALVAQQVEQLGQKIPAAVSRLAHRAVGSAGQHDVAGVDAEAQKIVAEGGAGGRHGGLWRWQRKQNHSSAIAANRDMGQMCTGSGRANSSSTEFAPK